jgi:adenosylhomocysteine nucleosidase
MIAITFALPAESRTFMKSLGALKCDERVIAGSLGGSEIELVHTGVGIGVAEQRLRAYLEHARPEFLIAAGFAGATTDNGRAGDIVLAPNYSDPTLLAQAEDALAALRPTVGNLFTAPQMLDSAKARAEVWEREKALAIDMETAAISEICRQHKVPLLSLRVLSDTPAEPFPLPAHVLFDVQRQRTIARRLVSYLISRPGSMLRLIRFSRRITRVRRRLSEALLTFLEKTA